MGRREKAGRGRVREVGSAGRVGSAERIREKRVSALGGYPFAGESRAPPGRARGGLGRAGSGWDRAEGRRGHALKTLADLKVDLLVAVQRLVRAPLRGGVAFGVWVRARAAATRRGAGAVTRAEARREARGLREERVADIVRRSVDARGGRRGVCRGRSRRRACEAARRFRRSEIRPGDGLSPCRAVAGRARAAVAWCRQIADARARR